MSNPKGMKRYEQLSGEEFAARIRAARAYLGLKLDEAGDYLGISRKALSRRENNAVLIPTTARFVMATVYCELTGWPVEFFTDEELPPMSLTSPGAGDGDAVEPGDVVHLVGEPPNASELP